MVPKQMKAKLEQIADKEEGQACVNRGIGKSNSSGLTFAAECVLTMRFLGSNYELWSSRKYFTGKLFWVSLKMLVNKNLSTISSCSVHNSIKYFALDNQNLSNTIKFDF